MSGLNAPWFLQQFRDTDGSVLSGGKLYFFVAGSTSIPKNVYTDFPCTVPFTQPVVLNASGFAPEYFMESGLYKVLVRASDDRLIATRDNVSGIGGGSGGGSDSEKVKINADDTASGYLAEKLYTSPTVVWDVIELGGGIKAMRANVDVENILTYTVKTDSGDPTPGFLNSKIASTSMIALSVDLATHKLKATFTGAPYVPVSGGSFLGPVSFGSITALGTSSFTDIVLTGNGAVNGDFDISGTATFAGPLNLLNLPGTGDYLTIDPAGAVSRTDNPDTYKVIYDALDPVAGYLGTKIAAGTGIELNTTTDLVNGTVIHISTTDPLTAPLNEVLSGNGAGGVLSSPLFKAVGGDVAASTFTASEAAQMTQAAWGSPGDAWFGPVGHNPSTDNGNLSGMTVGEYNTFIRSVQGGSASIGTNLGRLAVYDTQASFDVPTTGPAFHQLDAVILTGSSYTSTFHATICFNGTGTSFAVPAGSGLNRTIRLSNSSSVSVSVTGVATAFTLAAGASRDLFWDFDSVTPKWY